MSDVFVKPRIVVIEQDFTTTNSFASVKSDYFFVKAYRSKIIEVINEDDANDLDLKILVSNDKTNWKTKVSSTTLAAGSEPYVAVLTEPWLYIDVQVKSTVADQQASGKARVVASTL